MQSQFSNWCVHIVTPFPSCWQTLKEPQFIAESAESPNKRVKKPFKRETILSWGWKIVVHKLTWKVKGIYLRSAGRLIRSSPSKLKLGFRQTAGVQPDPVRNEAQNEKPNWQNTNFLLEDPQPASPFGAGQKYFTFFRLISEFHSF